MRLKAISAINYNRPSKTNSSTNQNSNSSYQNISFGMDCKDSPKVLLLLSDAVKAIKLKESQGLEPVLEGFIHGMPVEFRDNQSLAFPGYIFASCFQMGDTQIQRGFEYFPDSKWHTDLFLDVRGEKPGGWFIWGKEGDFETREKNKYIRMAERYLKAVLPKENNSSL